MAIGERRLIDGGVVNNVPISHAVELGAERIHILPTQAPHERPTRIPTGALDGPSREPICSWAVGSRPKSPGTRQRPS